MTADWCIPCFVQRAGAAGAKPTEIVPCEQKVDHASAGGARGLCFAKVSIMIMGAPQAWQV